MVSNVRNSKVRLNENNQNRTSNIVSKQADVTKIEPKGQEIKNGDSIKEEGEEDEEKYRLEKEKLDQWVYILIVV